MIGFSNVGPIVGWEGSVGYGPLLGLAGGSVRPLAQDDWLSVYAAGEVAIGLPINSVKDPSVFLTGGISGGGHLTTGGEQPGGAFVGGWGAVPFSIDSHTPCETPGQTTRMASITVGVRLFLGHDLWEAYLSPKLGLLQDRGGCPDIYLRAH